MTSYLDADSEQYRKLSTQLRELEEKLMDTLSPEQFRIYHELQVCRFQIDALECARISAVKQEILNLTKAECIKNTEKAYSSASSKGTSVG